MPALRARGEDDLLAQSPHICTLFDVGHEGDARFSVIKLSQGSPSPIELQEGPLPARPGGRSRRRFLFFVVDGDLVAQRFDAEKQALLPQRLPIAEAVRFYNQDLARLRSLQRHRRLPAGCACSSRDSCGWTKASSCGERRSAYLPTRVPDRTWAPTAGPCA